LQDKTATPKHNSAIIDFIRFITSFFNVSY
jgi:hypothetical protein